MHSIKKSINKYNRKKCFEILGYNFMPDIDLNPFLIEIKSWIINLCLPYK